MLHICPRIAKSLGGESYVEDSFHGLITTEPALIQDVVDFSQVVGTEVGNNIKSQLKQVLNDVTSLNAATAEDVDCPESAYEPFHVRNLKYKEDTLVENQA